MIAFMISSCNDTKETKDSMDTKESKETKDSKSELTGKWRFEKMEKAGETMDPGEAARLEERNKNLTLLFANDGKYYFLEEEGSLTDTVESGRYEIINNGKQLVTIRTAAAYGDTVEILELKSNTLKFETREKDIYIVKKVQ